MGNNQTEKAFEEKRLAQTISLAEEQLKQAKEAADKKKSEIIEAKKDVRENTEHGITSLYTLDVLLYEKTAIKRCMFMIGDRRLPVFSIVL